MVEWELEQQTALLSAHRVAIAERQVREELHRALLSSARRCKTLEDRHELVAQLVALSEEEAKTPVAPRLLVDDATPEALAMVMAAQQQRIALLEAEGGFFDILSGRYSSGVPNLDVVLKAWNGEAIRIDRRHADPIMLDNPTLTLILTAQPDVLSGMAQTPSFRGRGLMGRLLFFIPQSRVGLRHVETFPVPESLRLRWRQTLRTCWLCRGIPSAPVNPYIWNTKANPYGWISLPMWNGILQKEDGFRPCAIGAVNYRGKYCVWRDYAM